MRRDRSISGTWAAPICPLTSSPATTGSPATMTENHAKVTQDVFLRLLEKGYMVKRTTTQYYDPEAERFLPDRYVEGTCPHCGYTQARGAPCETWGRTLDAIDLIDPRSRLTGATPVLRETEHYFFQLPPFAHDRR